MGDGCWLGLVGGGVGVGLSVGEMVLAGGLGGIDVGKWGQPRKFAVCAPPQLQQVGGVSLFLVQVTAAWFPAHLTHLGWWPQLEDPCPKR